jgi:hypothetical protein
VHRHSAVNDCEPTGVELILRKIKLLACGNRACRIVLCCVFATAAKASPRPFHPYPCADFQSVRSGPLPPNTGFSYAPPTFEIGEKGEMIHASRCFSYGNGLGNLLCKNRCNVSSNAERLSQIWRNH